jgi:pyruvate dehydrogenase (quinone)
MVSFLTYGDCLTLIQIDMANTVGDFLIQRLIDWNVERIFGYPGDGINGIMGALRRKEEEIAFIQARHEEMASFMACGHAKFTGKPGVCLAPISTLASRLLSISA